MSAVRADAERDREAAKTAEESRLSWSSWRVGLNQTHPRFRDVREALRAARIPLAEIFGGEELPKKWMVSLNYSLPVTHKLALLRAVLPFGFDGVMLWDPVREAEESEDVYIGAYGGGMYVAVSEEFMELIGAELEEVDLRHYFDQHSVKLDG